MAKKFPLNKKSHPRLNNAAPNPAPLSSRTTVGLTDAISCASMEGEESSWTRGARMSKKLRVPSYCHHKAKGLAYVRLNGECCYLGAYGSPESMIHYERLVAEWLARGRVCPPTDQALSEISVNEVLLAYWRHAEAYYVMSDGSQSRELDNIRVAIRPLKELYGDTPAAEFGPLAIKTVRNAMIASDLSRNVINQRIGTLKRVFKWAVAEELVPSSVHHGLQAVDGLRRGRSPARETAPVKPVPDAYVEAILPFLTPTVRTMVQIQRLTGMRSSELCIMRPCDIDTSDRIWLYRPARHKTEHHGHEKVVPLGPRCQELLEPFLTPEMNIQDFIFSPARAYAERMAAKRATRKTKVQPSQKDRSKRNPRRKPGKCYDRATYARAISYGIKAAKKAGALPEDVSWHPHQLRHSLATEVRKKFGLDAARAMLGHRSLSQSAEYAELDTGIAITVASKVG